MASARIVGIARITGAMTILGILLHIAGLLLALLLAGSLVWAASGLRSSPAVTRAPHALR